MTKHEIKAVLDRVLTWPENLQQEAAEILLALEGEIAEFYEPSPEEWAAVQEGLAQADRGEFATDEEVQDLLNRPWSAGIVT
jgi:predicted transcriptional regulator